MLRILIARTRLLTLKPSLSILTRFSTDKQQKGKKTYIEQISTSTSLLELVEHIKKREADQEIITQLDVVETIKFVNRMVTERGFEDQNQVFIECCRILQKNLHKVVQACVSLQQLVELREILYGIKLVQQSLVVEKMYPMLTKNFQFSFRQLQGKIRCQATAKSIQNYLKYLIAYYSDFYYIDYKLYRVLSQAIYNNLKKITKSQLLSIDPHVILLTIRIYGRRFQISSSEKYLVDQLISVLALFDNNKLLTSLHHVMLYLYYQGTGLRNVSISSRKFILINKQKVTKLLSQDDVKRIPHNCLNFFLKHSSSHKYQQFDRFLQTLTNKIIECEDMEMVNYTTLLKLLKSAFRFREYLVKRIKLQNMQKLELIIKKYLQDRQQSSNINNDNANQESFYFNQLYTLLEIGVLDSFLPGLLPQIVTNNIIVNTPRFIYMLATKGIFHSKFIEHLEKHKPVANKFLNGDLGQKVASIQRIIAVKLYSQNKEMKLSKELLQTLEQLTNFFHNFRTLPQFCKFQYGLNCKFTLLLHFHRAFGHIYYQALTETICDARNAQGRENLISIFQYAITACHVDEFIKLCSSNLHIFDLVLLTKLLWHFQITFYKQHALLNLLALLYSFRHLYTDKNANQTSMNQICIFISRTDRAHTFAKLNSFWLMQIFRTICQTAYSNKFITNKVQGILVNLASRELQYIKNNPDYIRLQKYLILQKLNTITNHILIKQLIDFSINRNIHSKESLSCIQDKKFNLKSKNNQMLIYVLTTNVLVGIPVDAHEVKDNLRNIFANRRMPYNQLIKIQPELKSGLDHLCSSQNLNYIYPVVLMFAFPTMTENYELTILTPLLKTINKKHKFHYSNSLYYLTLPHLLQLSLTIPNASQLRAPTTNHIKNVTQFHNQIKEMLSKTIAFLTNQKCMQANMAQLHIDTHITILQLCIRYSLLNLVYLEELLRMCAWATGALKTRIRVDHLLEICGLVGKLVVIRDSQIFKRLESEDGPFPPDICSKYLNELIPAGELMINQQKYLQKILKRNSKLTPLMISYLKKRIGPLRPLLQILPIDNSLTVGSKCPTLDILVQYKITQQQALTNCSEQSHRIELIQLQQNCKLIKTVTKQNISKYYSVLNGQSLQLYSATTLYMIYVMIAQLGQCRIQHVFLCCEDAAVLDCLKNGGIQRFQAMYCLANVCKFIQSKQK